MAKDNRDLFSADWQEQSDSSWVAVTEHYKMVAIPKDPEYIGQYDGNWQAILYRWDDGERIWVQVETSTFGEKGDQASKLRAEALLGNHLEKLRREADPDLRRSDIIRELRQTIEGELQMMISRQSREREYQMEAMTRRAQLERDYFHNDARPPLFPRP